jgi:hypothetical protein
MACCPSLFVTIFCATQITVREVRVPRPNLLPFVPRAIPPLFPPVTKSLFVDERNIPGHRD